MKKTIIFLSVILGMFVSVEAQDNIAAARATALGQTVTITGIVTNGAELGPIRFMQDETAGIAVYSASLSEVKRGDEITVTGVLKDYNTLLEVDPVSSFTVNSSDNVLPEPILLTPAQFAEEYEGMLVKVNNVDFNASGSFERKSYTFTADGEGGQIYINSFDSPLIGQVIPTNEISMIGPLSVYNDTYQMLPRDQFDLLSSSTINMTSVPLLSNLSASGFTVAWTTDAAGTTQAFYGNTMEMELGELSTPGETTSHSIDLSGLSASELIYLQPFSVKGSDTAKAAVQVYITQSESSGQVKAYFNRPVDNSVSLGLMEAVYLDYAIDDTLIAYINRAQESIDFTIYNFNNNGISNISDALNAAHSRGVRVRVIYDSNIDAVGVESLDAAIGRIASPQSEYPIYGIMHNKFIVFDAGASDPNLAYVWTGATNFTDGQINTDPNNVILVQDKSLAKAFELEFNEMFGSAEAQPDPSKSKFGPDKEDNTPHEFIINGKRVECYFSPSDGTHTRILDMIETADHSIHIATMLITKSDIAYDLRDKNDSGVDVKVLLNDYDQYGEPIVNIMKASLEADIRTTGETGIMHHKYMIVDQDKAASDPILLTGSHNWSSSAQFRNDENTLIFHDQAVANAYYQDFVERFSYGQLVVPKPECSNDFVTMTGGSNFRYDVLFNDDLPGPVTVSVTKQPSNGTATVESDQTITYIPAADFNQDIDTIEYQVCLQSSPGICDDGLFVIYVNKPVGIQQLSLENKLSVYPVPASDVVFVQNESDKRINSIIILDQLGRELKSIEGGISNKIDIPVSSLNKGVYFLRVAFDTEVIQKRIILQ